ncbi:MAG TPA: hypothetical protein VFO64_07955 [Gaiellaceae bacterium]|nr:hypothetical protein [Gaiellaceae bacterium]
MSPPVEERADVCSPGAEGISWRSRGGEEMPTWLLVLIVVLLVLAVFGGVGYYR